MNEFKETADDLIETATDRLSEAPRRFVPAFWRDRKGYDRSTLRADLTAGLTVAALSLPQSVGFALIAGLPPQMVLAAVVVAGLAGAWFTSSRHAAIGPTNTTSIFIATTAAGAAALGFTPVQVAIFLALTVGLVQVAAGLAQIGNLTQFISRSVILGYTTGAAVLIGFGQLPHLLGLADLQGNTLLNTARGLAVHLAQAEAHIPSAALAGGSLALLFVVRRLRPRWPAALVVLGVATAVTIAFDLHAHGVRTVADIGGVLAVLPVFSGLPENWLAALPTLLNSAFAFAVMGMLEAVSIAKNIAVRTGQRIDPNQELLALGAGNVTSSLFGAMPVSGSFLRSAVNYESGGRTQLAAAFASVGLGLGLLVFAPLAGYIPVPAVAATLLLVALQMVDLRTLRTVVRATRADSIVFLTTLASTLLLNLDTAIYVGVGVSLALFLQKAASPTLVEYSFNESGQLSALGDGAARANPQVSIIHVEGDLFFGAADLFQDEIRRLSDDPSIRVFILRMKNARHLDGSTVLALDQLAEHLRGQDRHLLISGIQEDAARVLERSGLARRLGRENLFAADDNPTLATKRALERARQLIGAKADVRLFYEPRNLPGGTGGGR